MSILDSLILGITTHISFEDENKLKKLFDDKHGFCFNGQASKELKKLIIEKQMEKEEELSNVKSKIQEFKILEAFGESAPQFILQACAILNRLITEKIDQTEITSLEILKLMLTEVTTTEILTLTSSYLSVITTVVMAFQKMPFFIDGKKEAPYNCWKNYLIVLPAMILIVTPRDHP